MEILQKESLARYSNLRIGGDAEHFCIPESEQEILDAVAFAMEKGFPIMAFGGGSNIAFDSKGIQGLVMKIATDNISIDTEKGTIVAASGTSLAKLVKCLAESGFDASNFAGVPGTVGGAVVNNTGRNNAQISNHVVGAKVLDPSSGITEVGHSFFRYDYRSSKLKHEHSHIVLSVALQFVAGDIAEIREKVRYIVGSRAKRQPTGMTLGSTFKNPATEVNAWQLIQDAGLAGYTRHGLRISDTHCNWILNEGGADTSSEALREFIEEIRDVVSERTGYLLEPEIQIISSK